MLRILPDGTIKLTRGDTARLSVSIANDITGSEYVLSEKDELYLTVKKTVNGGKSIFQKKLIGQNVFRIEPEDTSNASFGRYRYDIQLNTETGDVYTIIEDSCFEIMPEVTC